MLSEHWALALASQAGSRVCADADFVRQGGELMASSAHPCSALLASVTGTLSELHRTESVLNCAVLGVDAWQMVTDHVEL